MSPVNQDDVAVVPGPVTVGDGSSKKKRKPRTILSPEHMSALIASYKLHFEHYSKTRENVTQLVPSSVWKKVHTDFLALYPEGTQFDNEHLKTRVRNTLKDMEANSTTDSSKSLTDMVAQGEQVLKRLKMTGASPLMQQVLWRNHTAGLSNNSNSNATSNSGPVSSPDGNAAAGGTSQSPGADRSEAPQASKPLGSKEAPTSKSPLLKAPPLSKSPTSQAPPSSKSSSPQGGQSGGTTEAEAPEQQTNASSSESDDDHREPMRVENAVLPQNGSDGSTVNQSMLPHPMSQESLIQMQASALYKISVDFGKLSVAFIDYLEHKKATVKQEEIKQMLANLEKACEMGVVTHDEMKTKARSILRL